MALTVQRVDKFGWSITNTEDNVQMRTKGKGGSKEINFYFKGKLDGKQKSFSLTKRYGITKLSDAKAKARELVAGAKHSAILGIGNSNITLKQAFDYYQSTRKVSQSTLIKDESFFNNHVFKVIKPNRRVQSITTHDLNTLLMHLLERKLSQSVMNDIKVSLKEIFRQYHTADLFRTATKWQSRQEKHDNIIDILVENKIELHDFVQCAYKYFRSLDLEYRVIMQLSLESALRIGEARHITVSMVDLDEKSITASKEITKTSIRHSFPISDEVLADIKTLIKKYNLTDNDTLSTYKYYQPYSRKYKWMLEHCLGMKREDLRYVSTHSNRKLFVTLMSVDGTYSEIFLDSLLSHSNGNSNVQQIYNKSAIIPSHTRKVFELWWQILRG